MKLYTIKTESDGRLNYVFNVMPAQAFMQEQEADGKKENSIIDIDAINKSIKKVQIKDTPLKIDDEQLKSEYSNFPYDHDPLDDKNIAWTQTKNPSDFSADGGMVAK